MQTTKKFKKIIVSILSSYSSIIFSFLVLFFLTPFMIKTLGDYKFGIWVLLNILIEYSEFTTLGVNSALQRYLAVAAGVGDKKEFNKIFTNGLLLNIFTFILIILISILASIIIYGLKPNDYQILAKLVIIVGFTTGLSFPLKTFAGINTAYIRFEKNIFIKFIQLLIKSGLIVVFLLNGYGLVALGFALLISTMTAGILYVYFGTRTINFLKIKFEYINLKSLKSLLKFGLKSFALQICNMLRSKSGEIIIWAFISIQSVTLYSIATKLNTNVNKFPSSFTEILLSVFSQIVYKESKEKIIGIFFTLSKALNCLVSLIFAGFLLLGHQFILIWLGQDYVFAYYPLVILGLAHYFGYIQSLGFNYLNAINKHQYYLIITVFEGVFTLLTSIILITVFDLGIIGVALGALIPVLIAKLFIQPLIVCKFLEVKKRIYYMFFAKNILIGLLLYIPAGYFILNTKIDSYLMVLYFGFLLCMIALFHLIIILDRREKLFLLEKIRNKFNFAEKLIKLLNKGEKYVAKS